MYPHLLFLPVLAAISALCARCGRDARSLPESGTRRALTARAGAAAAAVGGNFGPTRYVTARETGQQALARSASARGGRAVAAAPPSEEDAADGGGAAASTGGHSGFGMLMQKGQPSETTRNPRNNMLVTE